jgi:Transposase DDE domain group 1
MPAPLAAYLPDRRDPDKVRYAVRDLLRQRIFGLACGYEDRPDAARLADDPRHKLAVGRDRGARGLAAHGRCTGGGGGHRTTPAPAHGLSPAHHARSGPDR